MEFGATTMSQSKHDRAVLAALMQLSGELSPMFEAYREAYENEPDIGEEPDKDDDPDVPSLPTIPGADNPTFRDRVTGRGIRIFHTSLGIVGAPSGFRDDYGVEPFLNLTEGNFFSDRQRIASPDRTLPSRSMVEAAAVRVSTEYCTVDIERWWSPDQSGAGAMDAEAIENYEWVAAVFDGAISDDRKWGYYGGAPRRAYFPAIRNDGSTRTWMATNTLHAQITRLADFLAPSIYTFSSVPDRDDWVRYAKANMAEALRIAGEKPVFPFLWPYWHAAGDDAISRDFMLQQYETCLDAGASAIVIFITRENRLTNFNTAHREYFGAIEDLIEKRLDRL